MWRKHLFLFGVALFVAAPLKGAESLDGPKRYEVMEPAAGHFRCEIPTGWGMGRELREESRVHYHGFYLYGPQHEAPLPPTISVRYFAPDNTIFSGIDGYLRRQLEPGIIQLRGEKTSELKDTLLDGRPAKTFTRDTSDFFPPDSLDTREIPFHEEYIVASHLGGFVVLKYSAPTSMFDRVRPVFQRILDTFRFTPEQLIVTVRARVRALSGAREVDEAVVQPLLASLASLPGLQESRSVSRPGESVLWLTIGAKADLPSALLEIQRRISSAQDQLLPGAVLLWEPAIAADAPPLLVALTSSDPRRPRSELLQDLRILADAELRGRLSVVPGVAMVTLVGGGLRYEVALLPERLLNFNVDTLDVFAAIKRPAGDAAAHEHWPGAEPAAVARIASVDDLKATVVGMRDGRTVRFGDIAEVRLGSADDRSSRLWLPGDATQISPNPPSVLLVVQSAANADRFAVNRAVAQILNDLRSILPEFIAIECHEIGDADISLRITGGSDQEAGAPALEKLAAAVANSDRVQSVWQLDEQVAGPARGGAEFLVAIDRFAASERNELVADIRKLAAGQLPQANVALGSPRPPQTRFPGVVGPLNMTVSGTDLESLQREAEVIRDRLQNVAGVVDLHIQPALPGPTLEIRANRDSAARYGVDAAEIVQLAASLWERRPVAKIVGPRGRPISVVVMLDQNDPTTLGRLLIRTPVGAMIPLEAIVDIRHAADVETILRKSGRRVAVIHFNIQGRDTEAVLLDVAMILNTLEHTEGNAVEFNRE